MAVKNGEACRIYTVNIFDESYIIIFCGTIYFDMLSMQHNSKQELNKIYIFYIFGGFHVEIMYYGPLNHYNGLLFHYITVYYFVITVFQSVITV